MGFFSIANGFWLPMNFCRRWTHVVDGALVDIGALVGVFNDPSFQAMFEFLVHLGGSSSCSVGEIPAQGLRAVGTGACHETMGLI